MYFSTRFCSAKLGVLLGGENSSAGLRAVPGKCVGQMAIQVGLIEHFYFCGFSKMNWQARSKVVTHSLWVPDLELLGWNLLLSYGTYLGSDILDLSISIIVIFVITDILPQGPTVCLDAFCELLKQITFISVTVPQCMHTSLRYRLCGSGRLSLAHDHRDVEGDVKLGIQDTYIFLLYDNFFPVASIQKFVILLRSTTLVCVCVYVCVCMCAYACTYLYILMSLPRRDLVLAWHTEYSLDKWFLAWISNKSKSWSTAVLFTFVNGSNINAHPKVSVYRCRYGGFSVQSLAD